MTDTFLNIFKIKYSDMDSVIDKKNDDIRKESFFMINLNYLFDRMEKFFEIKNEDPDVLDTDIVVYNILNLIAHYRYYLFKYLHSNNNFIIFVEENNFNHPETLKLLKTLCSFFPKIRFVVTNNTLYTKYHCMKEILYLFRNKERIFYWFDIDRDNLLVTMLTDGNYYRIRTAGMTSSIKVEEPLYEKLGLSKLYKYDCKSYIPFIMVSMPGKRLKENISNFITTTSMGKGNDRDRNLMLNELYGKPEYKQQLIEIFDFIYSKNIQSIVKAMFKTWGHHIHDQKIMNFNEMVDTKNIDVHVSKLMCTL